MSVTQPVQAKSHFIDNVSGTEQKRRQWRDSAILSLQGYVVTGIGVLTSVITARALDPDGRGYLAILLMLPQLLSRLISFGLEQAILSGDIKDKNKTIEITDLLKSAILNAFFSIPILYLLLPFLKIPNYFAIIFSSLSIMIVLMRFTNANFIFERKLMHSAAINFLQASLQIIVYLLVQYKNSYYIFFAAWSFVIIFIAFISSLFLKLRLDFKLEKQKILEVYNSGFKYISMSFSELAFTFGIEILVIQILSGSKIVGYYAIAKTITALYYQAFWNFSAIKSKAKSNTNNYLEYFFLALLGIAIYFVSKPIILLVFGTKYLDAFGFLPFTLSAAFFLGISRIEQVRSKIALNYRNQIFSSFILLALIFLPLILQLSKNIILFISLTYVIFAIITLVQLRKIRGLNEY